VGSQVRVFREKITWDLWEICSKITVIQRETEKEALTLSKAVELAKLIRDIKKVCRAVALHFLLFLFLFSRIFLLSFDSNFFLHSKKKVIEIELQLPKNIAT
jgi:hypothetical protein